MIRREKANEDIYNYLQKDKFNNTFAINSLLVATNEYEVYRDENNEVKAVLSLMFPYFQFFTTSILPLNVREHYIRTFRKLKKFKFVDGTCTRFSWEQLQAPLTAEVLNFNSGNYLAMMPDTNNLVASDFEISVLTPADALEYKLIIAEVFSSKSVDPATFDPEAFCTGGEYFIKLDGKIVCGGIIAQNNIKSECKPVVSVFTHPDYRQRGLATAVVSHICQQIFDKGAIPILFYSNPKAASVYKKIGFVDVNERNDYCIIKFV